MRVKVDQSSKLENTNKDTVIAYANSKQKSLVIKAHDKREIQRFFREANKPTIYVFKTFAVLIYLLIRDDLSRIDGIEIDREYPGKEWLVKQYLLQLIRRYHHSATFDKEAIDFCLVGKRHGAHKLAIEVFRQKASPDLVVSYEDVAKYLL